jgi:hypothetical protein
MEKEEPICSLTGKNRNLTDFFYKSSSRSQELFFSGAKVVLSRPEIPTLSSSKPETGLNSRPLRVLSL